MNDLDDIRARLKATLTLVRVEPQPSYIESSGRWCWPLPEHARFPGCCTEVLTASREWWEYAPSQAKPHPMAEGVLLRDDQWYWAVPCGVDIARLLGALDAIAKEAVGVEGYEADALKRIHALATGAKGAK